MCVWFHFYQPKKKTKYNYVVSTKFGLTNHKKKLLVQLIKIH